MPPTVEMGNICPTTQSELLTEESNLIGDDALNQALNSAPSAQEQELQQPVEPTFALQGHSAPVLSYSSNEESQHNGNSDKNPAMGAHSRDSSDADLLPFNVALERVKTAFMKDFDIGDFNDEIIMIKIFNQYENEYIRAAKNCAESTIRLFAVLATKKDDVIEQFLRVLGEYYPWLLERLENERNCNTQKSLRVQSYSDLFFWMQTGLSPKFPEYNVRRCDLYLKLRQALVQLKPYNRVALVGDFGFGKKWLAIDVCSDYAVAKAMNFQIFWLDMRECTSAINDLDKLKDLYTSLVGAPRSSSPTVCTSMEQPTEYAKQIEDDIRKITLSLTNELKKPQNRESLVVLANVKNKHAVQAFNLPCKLLIITRRKKVADRFTMQKNSVSIKYGLTQLEVNLLFAKYLGADQINESDMCSIYTNSNGHPLLLSLIAQSLRQGDSWQSWIKKLQESVIRDAKLKVAVEKSLQWLEDDLRNIYLKVFSIFPPLIFVPFALLRALWHKERNALADLRKLYDYGFLDKSLQSGDASSYALPFIYSKNLDDADKHAKRQLQEELLVYYNVVNDLEQRKEVKMYVRPEHDDYFFSNIGYHLIQANRLDILVKLFFDFGFLEQKIRALGLLHTISDLEKYKAELIDNRFDREEKRQALREFLPTVEKTLLESADASLLQCALMESECIYEMASQQAANFPNHIWFEERGFFHQRHHIFRLQCQPKTVCFLDENICLIKTNKSMLEVNTSLDQDISAKLLHEDHNDDTEFVCMRVFEDNGYTIKLVLYKSGDLKLWSTKPKCAQPKNAIEKISFSDPLVAIECVAVKPTMHLYAATRDGNINLYEWHSEEQEFVLMNVPALKTKMQNIHLLHLIFSPYYLVATPRKVCIWNYKDYSLEQGCESVEHLIDDIELSKHERLLVCRDSLSILALNGMQLEDKLLWRLNESVHRQRNEINCAKLLDDKTHIVLGTKNGLIVFNLHTKAIILTTNISENIVCIDAKALQDPICKYIISCGVLEKNLLNLFALRVVDGVMTWAHKVPYVMPLTGNELQLPPAVQLVGGKLFEANYDDKTTTLMAVDSRNSIHKLSEHKCQSLKEVLQDKITAIAMCGQAAFAGCSNGHILNIATQRYEHNLQAALRGESITFMQILQEYTLIVASKYLCAIVMDWRSSEQFVQYQLENTDVKCCFQLTPQYLLLVLNSCQIKILDTNSDKILANLGRVRAHFYGGCDYRNKRLFLATKSNEIRIYDLAETLSLVNGDTVSTSAFDQIKVYDCTLNELEKEEITCLAVSIDASLVAVGIVCGDIFVYQYEGGQILRLIHTLKSHRKPIHDMKFSPNNLVLVSCAEQLNFWSVNEMLNNPLLPPKQKRNLRFKTTFDCEEPEEVDATLGKNSRTSFFVSTTPETIKNYIVATVTTPTSTPSPIQGDLQPTFVSSECVWEGKYGSTAKSTLLSCIKFAGTATKFCANSTFTRFDVVDNEGCYYALTVKDFDKPDGTRENYEPQLQHHYNANDAFAVDVDIRIDGITDVDTV